MGTYSRCYGRLGGILIYKTKRPNETLSWKDWLYSFAEFFSLLQASVFVLSENWTVGIIILVVYILIAIKKSSNESQIGCLF
ncbi:hypothetical protein UACE39S_04576 [Ureibacillus acetophenoni]